jgi:hypothetical protein
MKYKALSRLFPGLSAAEDGGREKWRDATLGLINAKAAHEALPRNLSRTFNLDFDFIPRNGLPRFIRA